MSGMNSVGGWWLVSSQASLVANPRKTLCIVRRYEVDGMETIGDEEEDKSMNT